MKAGGTKFLMPVDVTKIAKRSDGRLEVSFSNVNTKCTFTDVYDTVLYATGRGADTDGLNLAAAGVKISPKGTVLTDDHDCTNVPHIFAIGDVADGRPELTPVAIQAGQLVVRRIFDKSKELMDYTNIPTTVFTPFEYGGVGISEEEAIKKYGKDNVECYVSEFSTLEIGAAHRHPHGNNSADFPTNCLSKLVCIKSENERVVGFFFIGPNAGEITQGFALAVRLGAKRRTLMIWWAYIQPMLRVIHHYR